MKECKICGNKESHEFLGYCKICAEALCIVAEGATFKQESRAAIALTEEEAVHRLKLLIEEGWHHKDNCNKEPKGEEA